MTFLSLLLVLVFVQWWGSGAPVQKDGWFLTYRHWLLQQPALTWPGARLLLTVLGPVLALWLLIWLVSCWFSAFWLLLIAVLVLLYSLGRGDFTAQVRAYIEASERGDSVSAARILEQLQQDSTAEARAEAGFKENVEPTVEEAVEEAIEEAAEEALEEARGESQSPEDWPALHREALRTIAYRGFERMFAVIFWFFLLGPSGALLYRLSVLNREQEASPLAGRLVWLLEWPVVRLMGLTWSMAGNFDACFIRCQRRLLDVKASSAQLLEEQMSGALGATGVGEPVSLETVRASQSLLSRSLLIWVSLLALVTLLT